MSRSKKLNKSLVIIDGAEMTQATVMLLTESCLFKKNANDNNYHSLNQAVL